MAVPPSLLALVLRGFRRSGRACVGGAFVLRWHASARRHASCPLLLGLPLRRLDLVPRASLPLLRPACPRLGPATGAACQPAVLGGRQHWAR